MRATKQTRRIMELVCKGKRNKQIAAELGIAEGTVKNLIYWFYQINGFSNRAEAAARWAEYETRRSKT